MIKESKSRELSVHFSLCGSGSFCDFFLSQLSFQNLSSDHLHTCSKYSSHIVNFMTNALTLKRRADKSIRKAENFKGPIKSSKFHVVPPLQAMISNADSNFSLCKTGRFIKKSTGSAKKLTIKNISDFLPKSDVDDEKLKDLQHLQEALYGVYYGNTTERMFEYYYIKVESICNEGRAMELYTWLSGKHQEFIDSLIPKIKIMNTLQSEEFLSKFHDVWIEMKDKLSMVSNIFSYLDRTHTVQEGKKSVEDMGLSFFHKTFLEPSSPSSVSTHLVDSLLKVIENQRKGNIVDTRLLRGLLLMLRSLGIYKELFETQFFEATKEFYEYHAKVSRQEMELEQFFRHCDQILKDEVERVHNYLHPSTKAPLLVIIENLLICQTGAQLLQATPGEGLYSTENAIDLVRLLYNLLNKYPSTLTILKAHFVSWVKSKGLKILADASDPVREKLVIPNLLMFKEESSKIVCESFANNPVFVSATKDAFGSVINSVQSKPAELMAKYLNAKLRAGNKELSEDELDTLMDKLVSIFRLINGKDVFEGFYKRDLARRLLYDKTASDDAERLMLSKLKIECGPVFTGKLENMFKDIEISKSFQIGFKQFLTSGVVKTPVVTPSKQPETSSKPEDDSTAELVIPYTGPLPTDPPIDLVVSVLTLGQWPTYTLHEVNLPSCMVRIREAFTKFYTSNFNGRQLKWVPMLDYCVVRMDLSVGIGGGESDATTSPNRKLKELEVSLFQALVLFQFNEKEVLSVNEICELSKLEPAHCKRAILGLITPRVAILLRHSGSDEPTHSSAGETSSKKPASQPTINDVEKFRVNLNFTHKLFKVKVNQIQLHESKEEHAQVEQQVAQDRMYLIDAAIVRIMKTRKTISHNDLVTELFRQVNFQLPAIDVKKRIESLIERVYMVRDPADKSSYNYVA